MGSFSIWHWLIVLVIVLVIFGTKKLRNVGGDLGGAVKSFKEAVKEEEKRRRSMRRRSRPAKPSKAKSRTRPYRDPPCLTSVLPNWW